MNRRRSSFFIILIIIIILLLFILLRTSCCKPCKSEGYLPQDTTLYVKTIGWNILFKPGVSTQRKEQVITDIEDSVKKFYLLYNGAYGTDFTPKFQPTVWCPCDSALYTVSFTTVDGAGQSIASPPPKKPLGGQGDLADVLTISNNMLINEPNKTIQDSIDTYIPPSDTPVIYKQGRYNTGTTGVPVIVKNIGINPTKILAIMDSGIDSTRFESSLLNLIWKAPLGTPTLYNFLPHQPVGDKFDSGFTKHGSAVTAVAINAMENATSYPRLMILKTLDRNDQGSTFSVSCALSYAIQNHATLVNISLGYSGEVDSVLQHYIELCANHNPYPIQLFVAAGNTPDHHVDSLICSPYFNDNLLTGDSLFYPACLSKKFENITSVTQIQEPDSYCYYQYFSNDYISLGVLNNNPNSCCSFEVDFRPYNRYFYEGSSFATPFASGLKMSTIINTGIDSITNPMWRGFINTAALKRVTKDGSYIVH